MNLDGVRLQEAPSISYLGVQMANDAKTHVEGRASACRKALFALQYAGLHPRGLKPRAMAYLWSAAIRPALLYGCHCVATKPSHINRLQHVQGQLRKVALGLHRHCHHSPILRALDIVDAKVTCTLQTAIRGPSRAACFYLGQLRKIDVLDPNGSLSLAAAECSERGVSLRAALLGKSPSPTHATSTDDGITESVQQLLNFYCDNNRVFLNNFLLPY